MAAPDTNDPRAWLAAIDRLEGEIEEAAAWHASCEIDGHAATVRRALDRVLGDGPPLFVEVGDGQVLEVTDPAGRAEP